MWGHCATTPFKTGLESGQKPGVPPNVENMSNSCKYSIIQLLRHPFPQTTQVTSIIGSYAEAAKISLTPRRRAAALRGERLGDNEELFAGGHSKL